MNSTNEIENSEVPNVDDENNAESFDEDLLVDEEQDDTDISGQFPSDRYVGVTDPAMTQRGEATDETLEERVAHEEADPVVEELDRNARAEEAENVAYRSRTGHNEAASVEALLADIDDNLLDD
jgi:hypothetical protein